MGNLNRVMETALLSIREAAHLPPERRADLTATAVTTAMLDSYERGFLGAIQVAPWECTEVVFLERPMPSDLNAYARQGWEPWDVANVALPPNVKVVKGQIVATGEADKAPAPRMAFLVRFKRRVAPAVTNAQE